MKDFVKLIECPRDAMQGIKGFIPTEKKINYINALLNIGFDTLDMGSFVSPHTVPQMADTSLVLANIKWELSKSKLLAIVANFRGAQEAATFEQISYIGFPFSVSETFQKRNTNSTIEESFINVDRIQNLCVRTNKEMVLYISMGFGNPYGDVWNADIVMQWVEKIKAMGINIISLSDTVGIANPDSIAYLFKEVIKEFDNIEFGAHLHTTPETWKEKVEAAFNNGCKRFDGAFKGYGGCPMASDALVGNMPMENLISFFNEKQVKHNLQEQYIPDALMLADDVFSYSVFH